MAIVRIPLILQVGAELRDAIDFVKANLITLFYTETNLTDRLDRAERTFDLREVKTNIYV